MSRVNRIAIIVPAALSLVTVVAGCSNSSPTTPNPSPPAATAPSATPSSAPSGSANPAAAAQERTSRRLAEALEQGKDDEVIAAAGDQLLKAGLTAEVLASGRDQVNAEAGAYQKVLGSFPEPNPKGDLVHVVTQHATKPVRILFSFEPGTEKLNGLNVNLATEADVARVQPQTTPPTTTAHSDDSAVLVGTHKLPGTLTVPAQATKQKVAVILLAGSGPQDRDQTIGAAGNKPLRDIADGLAARGITTLRFDKRTKAAPSSFTKDSTLRDEYFDDTTAAITLLTQRPELTGYKIFLLGHSQGGMLLPAMLEQNPKVAGGISMAGSPRSLFDIMYDQAETALDQAGKTGQEKKKLLAQQRALMDQAKALKNPSDPAPAELTSSMPAAYIVSLNQQTPRKTANALTVPLLFVQGEADAQVSVSKDFNAWKTGLQGRDKTTFKTYPKLNHLFMPTNGQPVPADYDKPAAVAPAVIDDIASWLTDNSH